MYLFISMGFTKIIEHVKSASAGITAVCAIGSVLWIIFKEVNNYNTQKQDVKINSEEISKFKNKLDSLIDENNNLKSEVFVLKLHFDPVIEILDNQLQDFISQGVRFKQTPDGNFFYYYNNGFLYNPVMDKNQNRYFYIAEDGKTYWCK